MRYDLFVGLNPGSRVKFAGLRAPTQPEAISTVARALVALDIPAATIVPAFGFWEGTLEPSLIVTIIADDNAIGQGAEAVAVLALNLCVELAQDCIGVECNGRLALVPYGESTRDATERVELLDIRSEARQVNSSGRTFTVAYVASPRNVVAKVGSAARLRAFAGLTLAEGFRTRDEAKRAVRNARRAGLVASVVTA